jgi:hypothetical protein
VKARLTKEQVALMDQPTNSLRKFLATSAIVAAAAIGGYGIAGAATSSSSASTNSSTAVSSGSSTAQPPANFPAHGSAAHEDAEKSVTGAAATRAQAAAVKSVGSGTAGAVTTDFRGTGYEVTVTKSDGSKVEVHLDSTFTVMDHGPQGGVPGGGPQG